MKKLFFSLFTFLLAIGFVQAQVEDAPTALKTAKKLLGNYNLNQKENSDKLDQAQERIDFALSDATVGDTYKAWMLKGEIYAALAGRDVQNYGMAQVEGTGKAFALKSPEAGAMATEAYKMAMQKARPKKTFEKKAALKGLQEVVNHLATIGNLQLEKQNYSNAYTALNGILDIKTILDDNGMKTVLQDEAELNNHQYVTGYCAMQSDMKAEATDIFKGLEAKGYDEKGTVYSFLFDLMKDDNTEMAMQYLEKGSKAYPENKEILFSKINYYIQKEDYKTLQGELEKAIEAAPDNPSVYSALGNVYMNLFQEEYAADNVSVAEAHFGKSEQYYKKALELDNSLFDVQYSLGSLYYNKAVEITKKMNALADDMSKEATKKYNAFNEQAKGIFSDALPYFKKAESMNANDVNTLIALKEIFARLENFEMNKEFKSRYEKVASGGQVEKSYF